MIPLQPVFRNDGAANAQLGTGLQEAGRRPRSPGPEAKIVAANQGGDVILAQENGMEKLFPRHVPHLPVKANGQDLVYAVKRFHQPDPILRGVLRSATRSPDTRVSGWLSKVSAAAAAAQAVRLLAAPGQELSVAQVHAVKKPRAMTRGWFKSIHLKKAFYGSHPAPSHRPRAGIPKRRKAGRSPGARFRENAAPSRQARSCRGVSCTGGLS